MEIVLNHITRMSGARICIAGLDMSTNVHVRPTTTRDDPITRNLLRENGGPLSIGAVVALGRTIAEPRAPEVEDHRFATRDARHVRDLSADEYLDRLAAVSDSDLQSIFGPQLQRIGWTYALQRGQGAASLGVIRDVPRIRLEHDARYGGIKVRLQCRGERAYVRLTDYRFFDDSGAALASRVSDVNVRLSRGVPAFVMVGVSRPFRRSDDDVERHWLQVNGLCLADRPLRDAP